MPETVSSAVAQRDDSPGALVKRYSNSFATVLPSHIRPDTWVRLAQGALRKGKRLDNNPNNPYELEVAAANNPGVFLAALLDAARLGLEPGTEQYYLTPRKNFGQLEILGIVGYQGYVELMFRSGAVGSVTVQVVRENDFYQYNRGTDQVPIHRYPNFAPEAERGPLIGVYAYAHLLTGMPSQVVELNRDDIARIKAVNPFSDGKNSPWVKWEKDMWMKSAARQLRKWVPTSAEFRKEIARAAAEVQKVITEPGMPPGVETLQGDAIEGEFEEAPAGGWPEPAQIPAGAA